MQEDFLHYAWKLGLFRRDRIATVTGEPLVIESPGMHNEGAGPDFFNARIRIGGIRWAGNVEIHVRSSDWNRHRHQHDEAYSNVVLHVVYEHDLPVYTADGAVLPCLELNARLDRHAYERYRTLSHTRHPFPCAPLLKQVEPFFLRSQLDNALVNRLRRKMELLQKLAADETGGPEYAAVLLTARSLLTPVNALPAEWLVRSLPWRAIEETRSFLPQIEALLLGQAGWPGIRLPPAHTSRMAKIFSRQRYLYGLSPLPWSAWKQSGVRPAAFPEKRLLQLAFLLSRYRPLYKSLLAYPSFETFARELFPTGNASVAPPPGKQTLLHLWINTVIPLNGTSDAAGVKQDLQPLAGLVERLENTPAEVNHVVSEWKKAGIKALHAADTQAMIEMKTEWCTPKKCVNCTIGSCIVKH